MTTENAKPEIQTDGEKQFSLPLNLGEWVEASTLLDWVEDAVESLEWNNPELTKYLQSHPEYRPKALLALLTYAYSTQVLAADDIVRKCETDVIFRLICRDQPPTALELKRFRRENRGLIKGLLIPVFVRAVKAKLCVEDILLPPGFKRYLLDQAIERLDLARHMDTAEV